MIKSVGNIFNLLLYYLHSYVYAIMIANNGRGKLIATFCPDYFVIVQMERDGIKRVKIVDTVYTTRSGGELLLNFQKKKVSANILGTPLTSCLKPLLLVLFLLVYTHPRNTRRTRYELVCLNLAPNEDLRCHNRVAHVCYDL